MRGLHVEISYSDTRIYKERSANAGCFIMFSVITNICNKQTKGPALMEMFTATGKQKFFFVKVEMFDM
jgi:hypothetical protein